MGDGEEKEEILGQTEKEQLSETSRHIKPLIHVNRAHMGLYAPLWALRSEHSISLWHYPKILSMIFHIMEYMVYIFFRYYVYRYTVYRNWKKLDTEAKFLIDNHSQ